MFQTNFKEPKGSAKVARALRRGELKAAEDKKKREVRLRDRRCRFPLCGCRRFALVLHVSHSEHKGMGGNPKGERSAPELMVLACAARHRENRIAIDRGTLRWRPLTADGSNGPIAWEIAGEALPAELRALVVIVDSDGWAELAAETSPGVLRPLADWQRTLLEKLSSMTV